MTAPTLSLKQFQGLKQDSRDFDAHEGGVLKDAHALRSNEPQARSAGNGGKLNVRADTDGVIQQRGQQHHQQDQRFVKQALVFSSLVVSSFSSIRY